MKKLMSAGPLLIVFAAILWSLDGLLRRSLYVLPPLLIVFYEHLIGFLLLLPFLLGNLKKVRSIAPKTWGAMLWVTALSSILGTVLYTAALGKINYIQFSVVVLLQQMQPLFVVLFGHLILKERLSKYFFLWLILALVGAYLVSFPTLTVNWTTGAGTITAALFAVGAAFSWGSSTAFSRYALIRLPSSLVTGLRFGMAALAGFLLLLATGQGAKLHAVNESQLLVLVLIALTTGMVALAIYYRGLKGTPAWMSSVCELTWPLSAVVIDYVGFHKTLTPSQISGSVLLLVSIYAVTRLSGGTADTEVTT